MPQKVPRPPAPGKSRPLPKGFWRNTSGIGVSSAPWAMGDQTWCGGEERHDMSIAGSCPYDWPDLDFAPGAWHEYPLAIPGAAEYLAVREEHWFKGAKCLSGATYPKVLARRDYNVGRRTREGRHEGYTRGSADATRGVDCGPHECPFPGQACYLGDPCVAWESGVFEWANFQGRSGWLEDTFAGSRCAPGDMDRNGAFRDEVWVPGGCRLEWYDPAMVADELSGKRLMFVGDSLMRQMFLRLVWYVRGFTQVLDYPFEHPATYTYLGDLDPDLLDVTTGDRLGHKKAPRRGGADSRWDVQYLWTGGKDVGAEGAAGAGTGIGGPGRGGASRSLLRSKKARHASPPPPPPLPPLLVSDALSYLTALGLPSVDDVAASEATVLLAAPTYRALVPGGEGEEAVERAMAGGLFEWYLAELSRRVPTLQQVLFVAIPCFDPRALVWNPDFPHEAACETLKHLNAVVRASVAAYANNNATSAYFTVSVLPMDKMAALSPFQRNEGEGEHYQCTWEATLLVATLEDKPEYKRPHNYDCRDVMNLNLVMMLVNGARVNKPWVPAGERTVKVGREISIDFNRRFSSGTCLGHTSFDDIGSSILDSAVNGYHDLLKASPKVLPAPPLPSNFWLNIAAKTPRDQAAVGVGAWCGGVGRHDVSIVSECPYDWPDARINNWDGVAIPGAAKSHLAERGWHWFEGTQCLDGASYPKVVKKRGYHAGWRARGRHEGYDRGSHDMSLVDCGPHECPFPGQACYLGDPCVAWESGAFDWAKFEGRSGWLEDASAGSRCAPGDMDRNGAFRDEVWVPEGCRLEWYDPATLSRALVKKRLMFVGDSLMRQMFLRLVWYVRGFTQVLDYPFEHPATYTHLGESGTDVLDVRSGIRLRGNWKWTSNNTLNTWDAEFLWKDWVKDGEAPTRPNPESRLGADQPETSGARDDESGNKRGDERSDERGDERGDEPARRHERGGREERREGLGRRILRERRNSYDAASSHLPTTPLPSPPPLLPLSPPLPPLSPPYPLIDDDVFLDVLQKLGLPSLDEVMSTDPTDLVIAPTYTALTSGNYRGSYLTTALSGGVFARYLSDLAQAEVSLERVYFVAYPCLDPMVRAWNASFPYDQACALVTEVNAAIRQEIDNFKSNTMPWARRLSAGVAVLPLDKMTQDSPFRRVEGEGVHFQCFWEALLPTNDALGGGGLALEDQPEYHRPRNYDCRDVMNLNLAQMLLNGAIQGPEAARSGKS